MASAPLGRATRRSLPQPTAHLPLFTRRASPAIAKSAATSAPPLGCRRVRPVYWLTLFMPLAVGSKLADAPPPLVFSASALAVVPAAALMSDATEQLSARSGPGVAGLLNVTFGNAPELIIAFFALLDGLQEVVKASLVGSVIGNALLVLGAAMLAGGRTRERQRFDRTAAQANSGLVVVTVTALVLPAVLVLARGGSLSSVGETRHSFGGAAEHLSLAISALTVTCSPPVTLSSRLPTGGHCAELS